MRGRVGLVVGFGAGYYFGAKAGRERYEELSRSLRKLRRSDAVDTATDKAKAVVDLGRERARDSVGKAKDVVGSRLSGGQPQGNGGGPTIDDLPPDVVA